MGAELHNLTISLASSAFSLQLLHLLAVRLWTLDKLGSVCKKALPSTAIASSPDSPDMYTHLLADFDPAFVRRWSHLSSVCQHEINERGGLSMLDNRCLEAPSSASPFSWRCPICLAPSRRSTYGKISCWWRLGSSLPPSLCACVCVHENEWECVVWCKWLCACAVGFMKRTRRRTARWWWWLWWWRRWWWQTVYLFIIHTIAVTVTSRCPAVNSDVTPPSHERVLPSFAASSSFCFSFLSPCLGNLVTGRLELTNLGERREREREIHSVSHSGLSSAQETADDNIVYYCLNLRPGACC